MVIWDRSSAATIGEMCWTLSRWFGVSMNPPVPGVEASTKLSGDTHRALPVDSMTCPSDTPLFGEPLRIHLYL